MSVALLLIFLGLMALGVPIAISLGAASVIVLITMGNMPLTMVVQLMYTSMNSFVMVAVPLFILAGSLMDEGGIADKIYDLAEACVGWIYGGLGHVAILCNIIFGAMSGSSVAAVDCGKSVDTSMGFTPLAGLPMGTRCGDIDAGILEYLMNKHGYDIKEMLNILNKKSGLLGISGVSSDFRDLEEAVAEGNARAALALRVFAKKVRFYIGAYIAEMNGVDAIVFTAGVGENDMNMRELICTDLGNLGIKLDLIKNKIRGKETVISTEDSKVKLLLIPTNEELMIARDTYNIAQKSAK